MDRRLARRMKALGREAVLLLAALVVATAVVVHGL